MDDSGSALCVVGCAQQQYSPLARVAQIERRFWALGTAVFHVAKMEIVKHKREMEHFQQHLERIRSIKHCTDTSTPHSLGLKHLATRPKKQQLIEDRHQEVAKENKKLMERMTKIMASHRPQPKHERLPSVNETGRKLETDRVNFENKLLLQRIKTVAPVLNRTKMEKDYSRHLHIAANMRRKQMPSFDTLSSSEDKKSKTVGATFDGSSYIAQSSYGLGEGDGGLGGGSPIKTMAEFRKHVISTKKLAAHAELVAAMPNNGGKEFSLVHEGGH